jgi:hypothetical protein
MYINLKHQEGTFYFMRRLERSSLRPSPLFILGARTKLATLQLSDLNELISDSPLARHVSTTRCSCAFETRFEKVCARLPRTVGHGRECIAGQLEPFLLRGSKDPAQALGQFINVIDIREPTIPTRFNSLCRPTGSG